MRVAAGDAEGRRKLAGCMLRTPRMPREHRMTIPIGHEATPTDDAPQMETDRKINAGPPAQHFMKPPLSRYIALAQRRTMVLVSRRGPLLEKIYDVVAK
jgi:hypothetical protein